MRAAFLKVDGVMSADVDFSSGEARVTYDPARTSPEKFVDALKGTSFTASLKKQERP